MCASTLLDAGKDLSRLKVEESGHVKAENMFCCVCNVGDDDDDNDIVLCDGEVGLRA